MAEQNVLERPADFTYDDAAEALRKTAEAMAIVRVVSLAVSAQEHGSVRYDENTACRWQPAIDAACDSVGIVRALVLGRVDAPVGIEWWTPITLIEALGAALWDRNSGGAVDAPSDEEVRACLDVIHDSLTRMHAALQLEADRLRPSPQSPN